MLHLLPRFFKPTLSTILLFAIGVCFSQEPPQMPDEQPDCFEPYVFQALPLPDTSRGRHYFPLYSEGEWLYVLSSSRKKFPVKDLGSEQCRVYRCKWSDPAWHWEAVDERWFHSRSVFCHPDENGNEYWISRKEMGRYQLFTGQEKNALKSVPIPGWENKDVFYPCVSPDGKRLVFCSKAEGRQDLDLFICELDGNRCLSPSPMTPLNTPADECFPQFYGDGQLLATTFGIKSDGQPTIAISTFSAGNWSALDEIPLPDDAASVCCLGQPGNDRRFVFARKSPKGYRLVLASDPCPPPASKRLLLTIQISKYQHWPSIKSTPYADTLQHLLTSSFGFQLFKSLTNPTKVQLFDAMIELQSRLGTHDEAVILFRGHGARDVSNDFYLIPSNAETDTIARINWLPAKDILRLWKHKPHNLLFIFDACRSGYFRWEKPPQDMGVVKKKYRGALCSAGTNSVTDDNDYLKTMVEELKKCLSPTPCKGITANGLHIDIKRKLVNDRRTAPWHFDVFGNEEGSVFTFIPSKNR